MSSLNSSGGSNRIYDHRPIIPATNSTSTSNPTPSIPIPSFPSTTLSSSHPHPHPQQSQQPQQPPQPQHSNSSITTLSSILPSSTTHPSTARLHDLLEFVRAEFDQVSAESFALRNQREEYEQMSTWLYTILYYTLSLYSLLCILSYSKRPTDRWLIIM